MPPTVSSLTARYPATLLLFALLAGTDALFVVMHGMSTWSPLLNGAHYRLDTDRGLAEVFQYIKFLWLLGCLSLAFAKTRRGAFLAWMVILAILLVDDMAQLHETIGLQLAMALGFGGTLGLRPDDFGELLFAGVLGSAIVALVAWTIKYGDGAARHLARDMFCMLCALAFFGVFVDALHTIAYFEAPRFVVALTLLEDGGEMLVVSAMTAYAFDIASNSGEQRIALWDGARQMRGSVGLTNQRFRRRDASAVMASSAPSRRNEPGDLHVVPDPPAET